MDLFEIRFRVVQWVNAMYMQRVFRPEVLRTHPASIVVEIVKEALDANDAMVVRRHLEPSRN